MVIACIGWGSLIWDRQELPIQRHWFEDGPMLPIEFARISDNGRITLVIKESAKLVRSRWAIMDVNGIDDAHKALMEREGPKNRKTRPEWIGKLTTDGSVGKGIDASIREWAASKELGGVVWTKLPTKWKLDDDGGPTIEQVVGHLKPLLGDKLRNAKEYIQKAPHQIDTSYRRKIEEELGWTPID